jgi:glycosyltransferase involved in cell wall biosynthesis
LEKWAAARTDALVAVSEAEAGEAAKLGYPKERIRTVLNGVECPVPCVASESPVVGTLSSLRIQKDPLVFVEACARLHRVRPELRFQLCGAGPLEAKVRRRVERLSLSACLEMPGRVPPGAAARSGWSVFVLTSRYEGLSIALLEAMAAGIPVVATNAAGNAETVQHEETGLVVPVGDPDATAWAVLRLMDDPGLCCRLATAARARVCERYSLGRQLEDLTRLYRTFAAGGASGGVS